MPIKHWMHRPGGVLVVVVGYVGPQTGKFLYVRAPEELLRSRGLFRLVEVSQVWTV